MTQEELIQEYAKCYKDTSYAIKTYLETYDNTKSRYVPFILFPEQEMMLNNFDKYNDNIVLKNIDKRGYQQQQPHGFQNNLQFASKGKPEKVLITC